MRKLTHTELAALGLVELNERGEIRMKPNTEPRNVFTDPRPGDIIKGNRYDREIEWKVTKIVNGVVHFYRDEVSMDDSTSLTGWAKQPGVIDNLTVVAFRSGEGNLKPESESKLDSPGEEPIDPGPVGPPTPVPDPMTPEEKAWRDDLVHRVATMPIFYGGDMIGAVDVLFEFADAAVLRRRKFLG